jgi:hypothetical protein
MTQIEKMIKERDKKIKALGDKINYVEEIIVQKLDERYPESSSNGTSRERIDKHLDSLGVNYSLLWDNPSKLVELKND